MTKRKVIIGIVEIILLSAMCCLTGNLAWNEMDNFALHVLYMSIAVLSAVGICLALAFIMPKNVRKIKKRELCKYPMSEFYIYEDEVPEGTRVSTPEECEKCDDEDCDVKHCLIQEF